MSLFAVAVKEKLKARVAIDGPTGAGKTWTALQWARVLVGPDGPIGVIDTENRSAAYYAPSPGQLAGTEPIARLNPWDAPYVFGHMPWSPPYDPIRLTEMIHHCADELGDDGCLIIDSFSHFWEGEGGTLTIVDNAAARARGNSFAGWKEGTPAQRQLLDAIIHCRCHVIVGMRSKMEYVLEEVTKNGRTFTEPRKVGMKPIQREGVEYEFTVIADMDLEHRLTISKTRCSLIDGMSVTKGHSVEPAQVFAAWLGSGVERVTEEQARMLIDAMDSVTDGDLRMTLKRAFVDTYGKPTEITTDRVDEVVAWVVERVHRMNGTTPAPELPLTGELADALAESQAAATATGAVWPDEVPADSDVYAAPEFDVDGDGQGPDVDAPKGRAKAGAK